MKRHLEQGIANPWVIPTVLLSITTIAASGVMVWALINYFDYRNNFETKLEQEKAIIEKDQADRYDKQLTEDRKQPYQKFVGPDDYGRLVFDYPRTWSAHIARDVTDSSQFQAYLNPGVVPPINPSNRYALRLTIETRDYDDVIDNYASLVRKGDLESSSIKADDQTGTRLDGQFSKDIRGSAVIFKIRDKTVTLRTDAETFRNDFDKIVQITFNK
ncbi:hypothetical protein B7Y94_03310 [Candidatus Saccharibacteria bacterium 32-49-12]|nr:MAG: hypothetical protein B7Y94_03310 [Candidatus Saccharibacteria bacterium 32-49-12]